MGDMDMDMDMRIHPTKYTSGLESGPFTSEDVLSTNTDPVHGYDASTAALGAHSTLFHALAAVEEDDDGENSNDVLLRLLNEVRAVESDDDDDEVEVIDKGSDENAADLLALRHREEPAKPYMPPYTAVPRGGAAMVAGGFTVEGNASYSSAASLPPPPPPPPPPAYSTPSMAPRSPYANCYSGIPHLSTTPGSKPPPPSFAEAMATAHGTPASLLGRSVPSQECSPMLANYVPPMPAAPQETVLLRNSNGVFLLQPISKPTPPYTPPAGSTSPPVSPLPRYSLPPAAASTLNTAAANGFLGSSMVQASTRASSIAEPLHYTPFGPAGVSPYLSTTAPYSHDVGSVRGTPSLGAAPPPYACGAPRAPAAR
ncbi:conserved hypothetical protein [Leishmania mexicana MHOM/GT/2001/U1103]|uniref:Uncharacterized protein n=1 Tax=Leishmania mexicana (strain MHOM/GT/2001/U1103) TaxID=929439 RepID=E9AN21_LEIMU|nr:conserved hypothetical protein [Leishmania mexicana MHOM/GT/2001/U1103]CBZ24326.1 conserved hypothetical protein [Leishmania mexicana MHOM/GT/2001/U1103]